MAQLVEHFIRNERVAGSSPAVGSIGFVALIALIIRPLQKYTKSIFSRMGLKKRDFRSLLSVLEYPSEYPLILIHYGNAITHNF